jgi:hypothetical protein
MVAVERRDAGARATRRILQVNDPLLGPLISATDDGSREQEIERLISTIGLPAATRAIDTLSREEHSLDEQDLNDILGAIALRLVRKLQSVPASEEQAIARFEDYVHMVARHSAYDFVRRRFPERGRLRNRLRYLLQNDNRFELWQTQRGSVCALRASDRDASAAIASDLSALDLQPSVVAEMNAADAVQEALRQIGRPVRFEAFLTLMAGLWGITEESVVPVEVEGVDSGEAQRFESRQSLQILWREIELLRPMQRAALLLNLRQPDGPDAVTLFLILGIATADQIATAVGMAAADLLAIFNDLPLDDLTIAARLGITRQQVINLRKSARARLTRRLLKQFEKREA